MIFLVLTFILIIIIFYVFNIYLKKYEKFETDIDEYDKIMLNNNKKKLYKISLDKNIKIYRDECFDKCSREDCIKLDHKIKILNKCIKCNLQKNKCFKKSIIDGNCDDCNIDNIEDKLNCYETDNYGCPDPNNLNNIKTNIGVKPYYIQIPDNSLNSPFNKKCSFCWNIMDNL
jgi:hypothetical protein